MPAIDMPFISLSLALLMGVCLYAGMHFIMYFVYSRRAEENNAVYLVFGVLCMVISGYMLCELLAHHSTDVRPYVLSIKWREIFTQLFLATWPWFIFLYTNIGPRWMIKIFSIYALLNMLHNIVLPYGGYFTELPVLGLQRYPWGEEVVFHASVPISLYGIISWAGIFVLLFYTYIASYLQFRHGHRRRATMLTIAVSVFLVFVLEYLAVRLGVLNTVSLVQYGFPSIVIIMTIELHRQARKETYENVAKFRTLFDAAADSIFLMDNDEFVDCNASTLKMFDCHRDDIIGSTPAAFSTPTQYDGGDSSLKAQRKMEAAFRGEPQFFKWRHTRLDGTPFDAEVSLNRIVIDGKPCLQAIVRDISIRRRAEEALGNIAAGVSGVSGEQFFHKMLNSLNVLFDAKYAFIGLLDPDDKMQVNTLCVSVFGKSASNMSYRLESTPCENVVGHDTCAYPKSVQDLFPGDPLLKDMGAESYIGSPLYDSKRNPIGLIVVLDTKPMESLEQITPVLDIYAARASAELERIQTEQHIRYLAYTDQLTGLANRAALHEHMSNKYTKGGSASGALMIVDLDHFKTINDALSHDVGDDVLRAISHCLKKVAGDHAFVARIAGDEFAVDIGNDKNMSLGNFKTDIEGVAQAIYTMLEEPMQIGDRILNVGASIGVAIFSSDDSDERDVLRHADMALHKAKSKGRGNIQFYEEVLQASADERLSLEKGLRRAIELEELALVYQPQLSRKNHIVGAEVLLRWNHQELGQVSPDRFIPVAEETGLIHGIGQWVMENACSSLNAWKEKGVAFSGHLSINVSAWQFANVNFVTQVNSTLEKNNIDPRLIVLELTETALLYDVEDTIYKLMQLRETGVKIALDDFGTGYSSLAYLKDMPMDILKIDKTFVNELSHDNEHPLVESIIAMGKHIGLDVIAEGVEVEDQYQILRQLGCETYQGYYFSRPLNESQFIHYIQAASQ